MKDPKGAVAAYEQALALDPKFVKAWINLGFAQRDQVDPNGVVMAFEQALALEPKHPLGWYFLGNAYTSLKRESEALYSFERGIALGNPDAQKKFDTLRSRGTRPRGVQFPSILL